MSAESLVVPAYRVDDQFGRAHDAASALGTPAAYVLATYDGVFALPRWAEALGVALAAPGAPAAQVVPVLAIAAIPPLFRDAVRRLLPREPRAWTLLDWNDVLAPLRVAGSPCTIAVVDATGRVRHREGVGGTAEPAQLTALLAHLV